MKLDHLVLLASNLADSTRHYGIILPVLGFEKSRDGVWINSDGIAIDLRAAEDAQAYKRYAPGLNHFAVSAGSQVEFEQIVSDLSAAGIDVPAVQMFGDAQAVFIPDPDGLRIEIGWEPVTG